MWPWNRPSTASEMLETGIGERPLEVGAGLDPEGEERVAEPVGRPTRGTSAAPTNGGRRRGEGPQPFGDRRRRATVRTASIAIGSATTKPLGRLSPASTPSATTTSHRRRRAARKIPIASARNTASAYPSTSTNADGASARSQALRRATPVAKPSLRTSSTSSVPAASAATLATMTTRRAGRRRASRRRGRGAG